MESAKVALTSLILLFTLTLSLLNLNQLPHVLGSDRKNYHSDPKKCYSEQEQVGDQVLH